MTYGTLALAYILTILTFGWLVSWWFLLAIPLFLILKLPMLFRRARVLEVLAREYDYEFPTNAPQAYTLNQLERATRGKNLSAHDTATLFMAIMCNSFLSKDSEVIAFRSTVLENARRLYYMDNSISSETLATIEESVHNKYA